jgi:SAM-dependent methyltransferase
MVVARQRQMDAAYARLGRSSADFWERRADRFRAVARVASEDDPVVRRVRKLTGSEGTVLDVGAGTGRFAVALAPHVRHLTAVEPSAAMVHHLRDALAAANLANVDVVEQRWEEAVVDPATVVLCAHVLYPIADPVPFIRKLEAYATRAVVLAMMVTWAEPPLMAALWRRYHGEERVGQPEAFDAIAVLHEMGIPANVTVHALPGGQAMWSFENVDEAVAVAREHLILPPEPDIEAQLRVELEAALVPSEGRFVLPQPQRAVACIWWERDGPRRPPL